MFDSLFSLKTPFLNEDKERISAFYKDLSFEKKPAKASILKEALYSMSAFTLDYFQERRDFDCKTSMLQYLLNYCLHLL
jgi:hypothetical protein